MDNFVYYEKYLKYKNKYLNIVNKTGGFDDDELTVDTSYTDVNHNIQLIVQVYSNNTNKPLSLPQNVSN